MSARAPYFIPSKSLLEALRPVRRRPTCKCFNATRNVSPRSCHSIRRVSTVQPQYSEMEVEGEPRPRWAYTPQGMKAPTRARPEAPSYQKLKINDDPKKLDAMYIRFLGRDGHKLLSEETKWLAITHKSFDHGRRGFNDRLAFLGKRILELQTSLALLSTGKGSKDLPGYKDPLGRTPFQHPALDGAEALLGTATGFFLHHKQISALSATYGIPEIVRWWPKRPDKLTASGSDMVYTQAVLAILGGIALEQGGATANRIAKERVLMPMGLKPAPSEVKGSMDGTI